MIKIAIIGSLILSIIVALIWPPIIFVILGILAFATGIIAAGILFLLLSPLFKDKLMHAPDDENKLGMFIEVQEGRSVCIMKGGEPVHIIRNDHNGTYITTLSEGGEEVEAVKMSEYVERGGLMQPWRTYQKYVYDLVGLYAYIPFFTEPYTYDIPRYIVKEEGGKRVYRVIKEGEPGYRTDHLRHQMFTWYFVFTSVDIQKIPFTVVGSVQARIIPGKERRALFQTESWNVLLDMSLKAVVRSVLRNQVSLDEALGIMAENLKPQKTENITLTDDDASQPDMLRIARLIVQALKLHKVNRSEGDWTLEDFGIDIARVDIIDLTDELDSADRRRFFEAAIGREEGRARALRGLGEAEAAAAMLEKLKNGGETATTIIQSQAFVEALQGSDPFSALAGILTQNKQRK